MLNTHASPKKSCTNVFIEQKEKRILYLDRFFFKADFYQRRSRSRSRDQKRRAIRSSENQTDGVGSRTLILLMTPSLAIN